VRFLVDAQLPPALANAFREHGHDAIHVAELGLLTASDQSIWEAAQSQSAVLITKDQDFSLLRAARHDGPSILWIPTGNTDNRSLIERLMRALPSIVAAFQRGDTVVEFVKR
jgi:predicted nuclease of predicted toxin-antitoxin system